jgi:hypothetical protein
MADEDIIENLRKLVDDRVEEFRRNPIYVATLYTEGILWLTNTFFVKDEETKKKIDEAVQVLDIVRKQFQPKIF